MVLVNGEKANEIAGISVQALIERRGLTAERVAVEHNGDILRRAEFGQTILADGDQIEIVHFVGGG